jgi:hypothetical protein
MNATRPAARPGRTHTARTGLGRTGEATLADAQRQFPACRCWGAASGLFYARPREARPGDPASVNGGDPDRLWEAVVHKTPGVATPAAAAAWP